MEMVPVLGVVLVTLLGLLAGTIVDSVAVRVPLAVPVRSALRPQCSCGRVRRGGDAVPLLWLVRRQPCSQCERAPDRRRLVLELGCAGLFLCLSVVLGLTWELPAFLYLASLGMALTAIDVATKRLPNVLTIPAYPILGGLLLLPTLADARWSDYARSVLGGLAMFAVYLLLVIVNPSGLGFGDAKLAGILGIGLGWFGWFFWCVGLFSGFLLSALVSLGLLAMRRVGLRTQIPFGPFMVAGAFVGILGVPALAAFALASGALG